MTAPKPRTMPARPRELVAVVGLAVAADLAMWRGKELAVGGFGAAAFFLAVPALLLVAARARLYTIRLGATLAIFGAIAARCAYSPTIGTVLLGLLGVFALAITMRNRSSFLTDVVASFGSTFATVPQRIEAAFIGFRKVLGSTREGPRGFAQIGIPAVLVAAFVGLFALANPLVARWLGGLTQIVHAPSPLRVFTWLALLGGAVLLVRPAVRRSKAVEAADTTGQATPGALVIARNALLPLNIVFFVYNMLDATYLWAGSPPPGVSARQYAHEGAAWLTLTLALLTIVVGVMFRGTLAHDLRAKTTRILAFVWLGQGAVLAVGTFRRLAIHITTSGLSNIRIMGMFGTAVVAVGLVLVGVKLLKRFTFVWLLRRQLDALVLALLGFSILPTHLVSAGVNVNRVMEHEYQALVHVEEQAVEAESASSLLPLLDHDDERIRRGIAALLLNERDNLRRAERANQGWRDRDLASARALRELEAASPKLEAVLDDVTRPDAIQPFEYIRNSAIEGEIAQSEISKVKFAQTRSQMLVDKWINAHSSVFDARAFGDIYAQNVVVDGTARSRLELAAAKREYLARAPAEDKVELASPVASKKLDAAGGERVETRFTISHTSKGKTVRRDVVLVLERHEGIDWQIVEERGAGMTRP